MVNIPSKAPRAQRPPRIGLLWHSLRSENLGVGALAVSNIALVADAARKAGREVEIVVIGFGGKLHYPPAGTAVTEYIIPSSRDLLPGSALWQTLRGCDLVLDIGGGDSWSDIYGLKRFIWLWLTKEVVLGAGGQLVLSPQTIGPFENRILRRLAFSTMRRAGRVFSRDQDSLDFVNGVQPLANIEGNVDVAFTLPFEPRPRQGGRLRFGLNVSGLLYGGGYSGKDQFGSREAYRAMIDRIIGEVKKRGDMDVVLVPHVVPDDGSVEDDIAASRAVAARHPGVEMAPPFASPGEAKGFISGLDVLAGSRMHATIAAASSGVAVVPLAYSRKFRGVFGAIGYPLVGDCRRDSVDDLVGLTLSAIERRSELAQIARIGSQQAVERLGRYRDDLAERITALAPYAHNAAV